MTQETFISSIVTWINKRLAPGTFVGPDTELFRDGLIDSMRVLQLIAWTEIATGRTIPDHQIVMSNFETPRKIAETFVGAS